MNAPSTTPSPWCRVPPAALAVVALLVAGSACDSGVSGAPLSEAVVRDSAGISIVENPAPTADGPIAYHLSAQPTLVLGSDADADDPLYRVRGARRLADGGMVVANSGASQLRYYAANGTLRRTVGTKGSGPGEFQTLAWIDLLPGDSVITFDGPNRRYTVFDSAGTVARSYQPAPRSLPRPFGIVHGGTVLARQGSIASGPPPNGLVRDTSLIVLVDVAGGVGKVLARIPGDERVIRVSPRTIEVIAPPFAARFVAAATEEGFWTQSEGDYQLAHRGLDGRLERLVRLDLPRREATSELLEVYANDVAGAMADGAARQARIDGIMSLPLPELLPAIGQIVADRAGNLWVQDFLAPDDTSATWRVFDPTGRYTGTVAMAERLTVYEIGDDYVLGAYRDEDGLEEVRMYALTDVPSPVR